MSTKYLTQFFDVSSNDADVFDVLARYGSMSASQIAQKTQVSRTAVYDIVKRLVDRGLVTESAHGIKTYSVQSPEKIDLLITEKQSGIGQARQVVAELRAMHKRGKAMRPRTQVYEGREAMQHMMKDILLLRDTTIYAYWPIGAVIEMLTPSFWKKNHEELVARNIKVRVIWPAHERSALEKYSWLKPKDVATREIRLAPAGVDFTLGYVISGNSVRFLSSVQENYGFAIESEELATTMRGQFELVWSLAKRIN